MNDALRKFGIDNVYQVSEFRVDRTSRGKSEIRTMPGQKADEFRL